MTLIFIFLLLSFSPPAPRGGFLTVPGSVPPFCKNFYTKDVPGEVVECKGVIANDCLRIEHY
ncbi:hypothetical protein DRQ20_04635 [bacterium]|nr:MAG: hypothetical protein DRQ20_04635 [bacterium]